ncbi:General transcription and DNA repair factor IIH subunit ssl1 [Frankliniella fusca]|uniref:General transcription and DNA repair factor IIH subunit ssl1 n=1 Tax=Frankliniella fusca TaxID=407009 RepID=A0AAE1L9E1_9NEOP|nr:General transcription and DNA repair factor IIH subunit ssl1 [Frankliniella fusca]
MRQTGDSVRQRSKDIKTCKTTHFHNACCTQTTYVVLEQQSQIFNMQRAFGTDFRDKILEFFPKCPLHKMLILIETFTVRFIEKIAFSCTLCRGRHGVVLKQRSLSAAVGPSSLRNLMLRAQDVIPCTFLHRKREIYLCFS